MKRVAILISGSGSNMVRLIEDMQAGDHPAQPVLVASNDPAAAGLAKGGILLLQRIVRVIGIVRRADEVQTDLTDGGETAKALNGVSIDCPA